MMTDGATRGKRMLFAKRDFIMEKKKKFYYETNPRFVPEFCFKNIENLRLIVYKFGNREFLSSTFQNEKIS